MPTAADYRLQREKFNQEQYETERLFDYEPIPVLDATQELDPQAFMRRRAHQRAAERLVGETMARKDPMIDLLGGARLLLAAEAAGRYSASAHQNLRNDIRTGILEATQENGHISPIEVPVNEQGEANIAGIALHELFIRGIHPDRPEWANQLGAMNIHEEFLSSAHFNRETLRRNYGLVVISPLPEDVGADNAILRSEGYRPDSRKLMIRMHRFEPDGIGWRRVTEQLCMSGSDIRLLNQGLRELSVVAEHEPDLTTTGVLDRPFLLHHKDFPEGVASLACLLDTLQSERTGQYVFCGKSTNEAPSPELYTNLAQVSREREAALDEFVDELEGYAYALARDETLSFAEQTHNYERKKLAIIRRICALHPEYAVHAFGEEAAKHYQEAYDAAGQGDTASADAALAAAYEHSTSVVMCGVVIEEAPSNTQETSVQSAAERQESLHCLELKVQGYTIREKVNCPACTHVTGRKVRAYETVDSIRCMNDKCGYKISKEDGSILQPTAIDGLINETMPKIEQQNVVTPINKRRLRRGQRYQIGDDYYEYNEHVRVGGAMPVFTSSRGQILEGDTAEQLRQTLEAA